MGLGSPPQQVTVLVDTGSSELWVNPDCSTATNDVLSRLCKTYGHYDPNKSTTPARGPLGNKTIRYGDPSDASTHTSVSIDYYSDSLFFGNAGITNQTFGVVTKSVGQSQGILGLAPDLQYGFTGKPYNLVLSSMAQQGLINSAVFSLDLRHMESKTGSIIYGGIDRNKFVGTLERLPLVPGSQGEFRLSAQMSSFGVTRTKSQTIKVQGNSSVVMFDSGTSYSRLRREVALPIIEALGGRQVTNGVAVDCSILDTQGSVDFGFGNTIIRVPFKDFIVAVSPTECYAGLVITSDNQILGDTILRAGYFVFDWENRAVHVAQAANCGDNDIVTVGKGPSAVPKVTGNCQESDLLYSIGSSTITAAAPIMTVGSGTVPSFPTNTNTRPNDAGQTKSSKSSGNRLSLAPWLITSLVATTTLLMAL